MGRHAEGIGFSFYNFCRGCRSAEEENFLFHFVCQCPFLARCRYKLFGSPFLASLTEPLSINMKAIASFIKLSGWFSSVWGSRGFDVQPLR